MAEGPEASERARLEALRRRLYRADATEGDRDRFTRLQQSLLDAADEPAAEPAAAAAPGRRRLLVAAGIVAVLVAAGSASLLAGRTSSVVTASASPATSGTPIPASPDFTVPTPLGLSVDGVSIAAQRFRGAGSAIVPIDSSSAPKGGGTLIVVLAPSGSDPISWQAVRPATRENQASYEQVIAMSDPGGRAGTPSSSTSTWDGDPPTRIVVQQTGTEPWALTVAFATDAEAAVLH